MAALFTRTRALFAAAALLLAPCAYADGPGNPGPDVAAPPTHTQAAPTTAAPQGRTGAIDLMNGAVHLNVPAGYRFYSVEEAYAFLQRNRATAPDGNILGMIAPADERIDQPGAWATVLSYQDIGYVSATTAGELTAPNFEADVRAARVTQNRPFEGFAAQPAYNETAPGLAWAERSGAPGVGGKDLRHEQKMLARRGVLSLTSIGSADQLPAITTAAPEILAMVAFSEGERYADFQQGADTVSRYTIPALVTGIAPVETANAQMATSGEQTQAGFGGLAGLFPWIAVGVVVLAGLGYLFTRRRADPNVTPDA